MRSVPLTLAVLGSLIAIPVQAQTPPSAAVGANGETHPVPQTFDWWTSTPIPETTSWGQPVDVRSTELIRSWTTMPEYTSPAVDHLIDDPVVVSPTDHFGSPIGEPGVLHRVDEIYGYFEALAASTPRVNFEMLGETEEGNRLALVQIGSEENLARLQEIKRGLNALADPRATSAAEARRLVEELPAVYTFYAGLHSTETGPPEMVMELAHRLAVSDDPAIRLIRDSMVVFIVPVAEPDGRNRVVEWHRRHNSDVYDYDDRAPGPPYWGKYIFHDNNRDGLQLSARLTQVLVDLFNEWKYPLGHDLHESVPYLYVSTGTGPYNRDVDPIAVSEWQWMANKEVNDLTAAGMPGVWTHGFYDGWYPGYLLWVTNTRNAVGRFYETFGNSVPNTMSRELGARSTSVEWYRPNPPRDSTIWSLRNNTNYMQSGVLSVMSLVAQNRQRIMEQYWTKASNAVRRGETEAPYAFVVPADQPRRADVEYMLNLLRRQGIELHRADDDETYGDVTIRRGDYVVRMDQPYRNFAKMLMEVQRFPEDAPRPYDDVAWTFPLMFNLDVHAVDESGVRGLAMSRVTGEVEVPGAVEGRRSDWYVVVPEASAHSIVARYALQDVPMWAAEESFTIGRREIPAGAWLLESGGVSADRMESLAREHGLQVLTASNRTVRGVRRHALEIPRIALLHSWRNTQDGGWVRYALDQMGVPYEYFGEDELAGADLRARFDVLLFPSQGANSSARAIFQGLDPKRGPLAYTRTPEFPTHGFLDSSEDITGGMGYEGLAALRDFLTGGGTLITLGSASTLPVEFGLVRDVSLRTPRSLFVPGSIVQGRTARKDHPVVYGYGESMPLYHRFGPYFELGDRLSDNVVVKYAAADSVFLSGLVQNPGELGREEAILSLPVGAGHLVLFGFNPLHRYQSHGNFAFVWNAIMHWNDLGIAPGEESAGAPEDEAH